MASIHEYPITVTWYGAREGSGKCLAERSGTVVDISVPPEFQGPGNGTNPEELLTSAIASCYSITFGIMAGMRKLAYTGLETKAQGFVSQEGANFVFTKVVLQPKITLAEGATDNDRAIASDLAHKADLYCIITNAVRGKVAIEVVPTVV